MSAHRRLARLTDRARVLLKELEDADDEAERVPLEGLLTRQRIRSRMVLRGSLLLYVAITCFVGTSLSVAGGARPVRRTPAGAAYPPGCRARPCRAM